MKRVPKNPDVIHVLNDVLTAELTAINQYFIHAELCQHWGYQRLYAKVRKESIDEMKHAEKLMERILFLDGIPNMQRLGKVNVGETVPEQFKLDLALEEEAIARLKEGVNVCSAHNDHVSRVLLENILASEEEHLDWLEQQLELIDQVGEHNYLAEHIRPEH
jgi:bacterioferritin